MRVCECGLQCSCLLLFGLLAISQAGEKTAEKLPPEVAKAKKVLSSGKPAEKLTAVEALAKAKTPKATPLLVKVLDYSDGKLRKAAVKALKTRAKNDSSVIPLLVDHLGKSQRESAIEILSTLKSPKAFEPLVALLKKKAFDGDHRKDDDTRDKKWLARKAAARLLGELGDERAIPHLVPMLGSGLLNDAEAGAKALLKFGEKGRAAIIAAVRHKDPKKDKETREFKAALGRALGMATQQKFGTDAKKWQKWWKDNKAAHTKEYLRRKKLMAE